MADILKLTKLINAVQDTVDLSQNTLVLDSVKVGGSVSNTELTKAILDLLVTLQDGSDIASGVHSHNSQYYTETELSSTTPASAGGDLIGISGTPTNYTPASNDAQGHFEGIDTKLADASGTDFDDSTFRVSDNGDSSKKIALEASGITTSTTRTITMPDANVDLGDIATNNAKVSADGSVASHSDVTDAGSGSIITSAERTKLSNIEALADVTDSTNVDAAGATMNADTDVSSNSWVLDEDGMGSDSATKVPTQQSVKAYVDNEVANAVAGGATFQGDYDAATNSPDLDTTPIAGITKGDMYVATNSGTFFASTVLENGDVLIAKQDSPTLESHWTVVQANLTAASIKTQYESNADTNGVTDSEKTALGNLSGTNTGDEAAASLTVAGIVELATVAETDAGTDATRAVTPAGLATIQADVDTNTAKVGYTALQAKTDVVNDSITDSNTDTAPSENAVFDALATKQAASANLDEADTFFGSTDLSASEAETLSDGSNADSLHSHNTVRKLAVVAGESFSANTTVLVRWAINGETAGRVYKADNDASSNDLFYAIGVVRPSGAISAGGNMDLIRVGDAVDTFAGTDIGKPVYLGASGAPTLTAPTAADTAVVVLGSVESVSSFSLAGASIIGKN